MIILDTTSKTFLVKMTAPPVTTQPTFSASYADDNPFTQGNNAGSLTGTTYAVVVASPAAGNKRYIKTVTIFNAATAPVSLIISEYDGSIYTQLYSPTLNPGDTWQMCGATDKTGATKTAITSIIPLSIANFPPVQLVDFDSLPKDDDGNLIVNPTLAGDGATDTSLQQIKDVLRPATPRPGGPLSVSVGTSSVQIIGANGNRKGLVITNISGAVVSFGLGMSATINQGITLNPSGIWEMDAYTYTNGPIYAVAGAASSTVTIQEF